MGSGLDTNAGDQWEADNPWDEWSVDAADRTGKEREPWRAAGPRYLPGKAVPAVVKLFWTRKDRPQFHGQPGPGTMPASKPGCYANPAWYLAKEAFGELWIEWCQLRCGALDAKEKTRTLAKDRAFRKALRAYAAEFPALLPPNAWR